MQPGVVPIATLIPLISLVVLAGAWGALALWVQAPAGRPGTALCIAMWLGSAVFLAGGLAGAWPGLLAAGTALFGGLALLLAVWWLRVEPSNERNWIPEVAMQTQGVVEGRIVTLRNVRNFHWRGERDFDERWETRRYDLDTLISVDLALSYWGRPAIAHALVSFGFDDGRHVVFSVEIRRKLDDRFSELGGFFRQYELSVIASDERDSLRVRTNFRGEDSYLFRVHMPRGTMEPLFLSYVEQANKLVNKPRFYNTITANCTTLIYRMLDPIVPGLPLDYRVLASGYLPEYLYDLNALRGADSVAEYRRRGRYTDRARANADPARFSADIRRGVPGIPAGEAAVPDPD